MPQNPSGYDQALVCENGHVATSILSLMPESAAPYCEECGAPNLDECPSCHVAIRGSYLAASGGQYDLPAFCVKCGEPFPWTARKLAAGRELLDELAELDPEERESLKRALGEITSENPRTALAASRLRRTLDKLKGPVRDGLYKVAVDVASEAARKILLGG